jgi:hypothetical protein
MAVSIDVCDSYGLALETGVQSLGSFERTVSVAQVNHAPGKSTVESGNSQVGLAIVVEVGGRQKIGGDEGCSQTPLLTNGSQMRWQETVAAQDMLTRFVQRQGQQPASIATDATYGYGELLQWLLDRGITPYMRNFR